MTNVIHQEIDLPATPERVLKLLIDSKDFAACTGAPATIDPTEGGEVSCFGGMIEGRNIEIVEGQRLVQAWRVKTWEAGVFSIVRFAVSPHDTSTRVVFDHTGYPPSEHGHLGPGWHKMYWKPIAKFLEQKS